MPNTKVRAAGEAMPVNPRYSQPFAWVRAFFRKVPMPWHARATNAVVTQESVQESFMNQHVNRRKVLASSAAAAVTIAPFENSYAQPVVESPLDRVNRLARDLSLAMDDWMAALGGADDQFVAEIFPSKARKFPIGFRHNLGGWSPDEELIALAREFRLAEATWKNLQEECERTLVDFEERNGEPQDHCPTNAFPEYWQKRHAECDPSIAASADMAEVCDGIRKRLHAIPAKTIAGIAAKAQTLQFDTSLYPKEPERPLEDWDWDVECLHLFVEEVCTMAASFDDRFGRVFTTGLIPTGRGSYVPAGSISLSELLRRYDMAQDHTMCREEVIAAFA